MPRPSPVLGSSATRDASRPAAGSPANCSTACARPAAGRTWSAAPCATRCSGSRSRTGTSRSSACRRSGSRPCCGGLGRVDAVGQAFRVYKLSGVAGVEGALDVALPRRDSKAGPGHRGIAVAGDPGLPLEEAARRRDFTINALLYDPETDEIARSVQRPARPESARAARGRPAHASARTRCARCARCSSRRASSSTVEPATARLCAAMPLARAAGRARVRRDREAAAARPRRPSRGLALMREWGLLRARAGAAAARRRRRRSPSGTPRATSGRTRCRWSTRRRLLIDDLAHDRPRAAGGDARRAVPRPRQARRPRASRTGRMRSRGHEEAGLAPTESLLDRWNVHTLHGYDVRAQVLGLVAQHLKPRPALRRPRARVGRRDPPPGPQVRAGPAVPRGARRLSRPPAGQLRAGRDGVVPRARARSSTSRCDRLCRCSGAATCWPWAWHPGPEVGRVLHAVYERQLDGAVTTLEEARAAACRVLGIAGVE